MTARRRQSLRAVPDRPQRVVLYRRISQIRGRSGDDFHSPDIQLAALRRATAGMREVCTPVDDFDESGKTLDRDGLNLDRPGLNRIRDMVAAGDVDAVAFYNVSRLGRNVLGSLLFVKHLEDRGARILSATEHIDTSTAVGRMMLTNMLAVAQLQADQIGEAWSNTIASRAEHGFHHGRPYGYRRVKGEKLQPDPVAGPIVGYAFDAYARGEAIGEIAREVSRRRGKSITTPNIKKWFHRSVYLGHTTSDGDIVKKNAHPPLVDEYTWDRVQVRLRRDTVTPPRHLDPTWSLVGVIYCPAEHRLQRQPTRYRGERVDRLICGQGSARGVGYPCEGVGGPRLELVEVEVLRQVAEYVRTLRDDPAARAARQARRAQSSTQRQELERDLARTRTALGRLAKRWALDETMSDAEYSGPIGELRAAETELVRQLDELDTPVVVASPKELAAAGERLLRLWPVATIPERSRLLRIVVRRVVVRKAARWREPESDRVHVEF